MDSKNKRTSPVNEGSLGRVIGVSPRPVNSDHHSQEAIAAERLVDDRRSSKPRGKH